MPIGAAHCVGTGDILLVSRFRAEAGATLVPVGHIPTARVTIIVVLETTDGTRRVTLKRAVWVGWRGYTEKGKFTVGGGKLGGNGGEF